VKLIRLFVSHDLNAGAAISATREQAHYLGHVMRLTAGDEVALFNGRDGEWAAAFQPDRREARLAVSRRLRPQDEGPDLDLLVALVKRPRLEMIVEKAAELGAARVRLLITERINARGVNLDRLAAIATEAAEQTGRLDVPAILPPRRLSEVLSDWTAGRRLMFCDEAGEAPPARDALTAAAPGPWAILIGPEGGFTADERAAVRALPGALPVSLGPRILRADTAAIAALALWQACLGDWRGA
jgi:16S rRNA (uracil1498-N3)-methyltransferase